MHFDRKNVVSAVALGLALASSSALCAQPGQDRRDDRRDGQQQNDGRGPGGNGYGNNGQGNGRGPGNNGYGNNGQGNGRGPGGNGYGNNGRGQGNGRPDFHFDQGRRDQFAQHYRSDAMRWRNNSRRPNFSPGYVIPRNYAIRRVPSSYWAGQPAPPPGYQYGYYGGYVVAYNPTTRIVADVLDLVAGLSGR